MELRYIAMDVLEQHYRQLGPDMAVTSGQYNCPTTCAVNDLDWNHMDQAHRPVIHRTYGEAARIASSRDFAVSLTRLRFAGLPLLVAVTDVRIGPGLFYQTYTLFGLIFIHSISRSKENLSYGHWYIVSHRWLKPLHGFIHRRLLRLNNVQNAEDEPLRLRRTELRKKGYRFRTDNPDFLNSNSMGNNTIAPPLKESYRFPLSELLPGEVRSLSAGVVELLVRRDDGFLKIWLGACPHEGGPLSEGKVCGDRVTCPWHGLQFQAVTLRPGDSDVKLEGLKLAFDGEALVVAPGGTST